MHGRNGSGVTTIAVNLAVALVQRHGKRVALVDLDLYFADIGFLMDVPSEPNIADFATGETSDRQLVERCLRRHESGIDILPSAFKLVDCRKVDAMAVRRIADALSDSYEYVILDAYWHPEMLSVWTAALESADLRLLIAFPHASNVEYARQHAEFLNTRAISATDLRLVFNMVTPEGSVYAAKIEQALNCKAVAAIPYERHIAVGGEPGKPFILSHPGSEAAASLLRLARLVLGYPEGDADTSPPAAEPDPGPFRSFRFDELVQEAQKYVEVPLQQEGGEIRPAILALSEAVEANPTNFALVLVLGFFLKWSGEVGRAVSLLRRASELRPSDPRPYYLVADAYWTAALAGEVQFGSVKWFSNMLLEDQELRDEAPEAFVEVAESLAQMPREEEEYLNWISRRCREELGIDGPGAARTALELFDAAMRRATDPDNAMHVRQRMATVRAFSRSKGWN